MSRMIDEIMNWLGRMQYLDKVYPIGSIYMSVNNTDPSTLFGGTWEQIQDKFLLSAGTNYAAGDTGGESEHLLTGPESGVQDHTHIYYDYDTTYSLPNGYRTATDHSKYALVSATASRANHQRTTNGSGNKDATSAHNNMPPYLVVYVWKRTA